MLETNRLILSQHTLADASNLFTLNSDPDVVRYTGDGAFSSVVDAHNLVRDRMIPQFEKYRMSRLKVVRKEDNAYLGWCGLKYFPETNEVDLGYRFMKKYWGMGYATEASRVCLEYGFMTLNLPRIIAKAMPDNKGSIKVMQKLGMTFRGYVHDPTDPCPFILYDMKKSEFR